MDPHFLPGCKHYQSILVYTRLDDALYGIVFASSKFLWAYVYKPYKFSCLSFPSHFLELYALIFIKNFMAFTFNSILYLSFCFGWDFFRTRRINSFWSELFALSLKYDSTFAQKKIVDFNQKLLGKGLAVFVCSVPLWDWIQLAHWYHRCNISISVVSLFKVSLCSKIQLFKKMILSFFLNDHWHCLPIKAGIFLLDPSFFNDFVNFFFVSYKTTVKC